MELGLRFRDPVPQQIHSISGKPRYPGLPGHARPVMAPDSTLTAAVVERIYAEGRKTACLYTDLRNSFSNRCYARIGFKPVCASVQFYRCG